MRMQGEHQSNQALSSLLLLAGLKADLTELEGGKHSTHDHQIWARHTHMKLFIFILQ
jgi:hypothetical protein